MPLWIDTGPDAFHLLAPVHLPMAPPLLALQDIGLTFGGTPLLEAAELVVAPGERVCLVGRNGSGKSTLLKIAAGLVEPDRGARFVQPGATIRYLPQEPDLAGFATTLAYVEAGLGPGDDPPPRALPARSSSGLTGEEDAGAALRRRGAARGARARARAGARHAAARRADQPPRPAGDRMAGSRADRRCAPRSCSSATTGASSRTCRGRRSGSTAA